jgi:hypothetical protein
MSRANPASDEGTECRANLIANRLFTQVAIPFSARDAICRESSTFDFLDSWGAI